MDLKSMLLPEKVVSFDFPGCNGFTVDLAFLSKESNQQLWKKCQRQKIDSKTRQAREVLDEDLFLELYTRSVVKGWKGLKLKYLKELVLADIPEDMEEKELDYSEENALTLIQSSNIFDNWVGEVISDIANFTMKSSEKSSTESKNTSKKPVQD
jgi:hypothetical protein